MEISTKEVLEIIGNKEIIIYRLSKLNEELTKEKNELTDENIRLVKMNNQFLAERGQSKLFEPKA